MIGSSTMPRPMMGFDHFMPELEVVEPDWIHVRTPGAEPSLPLNVEAVKTAIVDNLTLVHDPEIPVNIYDLGLIYDLDVTPMGAVRVTMTLTAPNCPVAGSLPPMVETGVRNVPGVSDCVVDLTFDPPWTPDRCSEDAKLALGIGF